MDMSNGLVTNADAPCVEGTIMKPALLRGKNVVTMPDTAMQTDAAKISIWRPMEQKFCSSHWWSGCERMLIVNRIETSLAVPLKGRFWRSKSQTNDFLKGTRFEWLKWICNRYKKLEGNWNRSKYRSKLQIVKHWRSWFYESYHRKQIATFTSTLLRSCNSFGWTPLRSI